MGNVTLTSLLTICYVFFPGYLYRILFSYNISERWLANLFLKPFNFDRPFKGIFYCLGVGISVHGIYLLTLWLFSLTSWDLLGVNRYFKLIDFETIFSIVGGGEYSNAIYKSITNSLGHFIFYIVFLMIMSLFLSWLSFLILKMRRWLPPRWFMFYPPEFNGFSRKEFLNKNVYYWIDVATKTGNNATIYKGILSKAEYSTSGELHLLFLKKCFRRSLYCNEEVEGKNQIGDSGGTSQGCKYTESNGWIKVEGDFMVLPKEKILNLNIKLFGLKKYNLTEFQKQYPRNYQILLKLINSIQGSKKSSHKLTIEIPTSSFKILQYLNRKSFTIKPLDDISGTELAIKAVVDIHECFRKRILRNEENSKKKRRIKNNWVVNKFFLIRDWIRNQCFFRNH